MKKEENIIDEEEKENTTKNKKSEIEKEEKKREKMVTMRMSEEEYLQLKDNSEKSGMSVSEFVRKLGTLKKNEEMEKKSEERTLEIDNTDIIVDKIDAKIKEMNKKSTKNIMYLTAAFFTGYIIGVVSILIVVLGVMKIGQ